jgi:hypothetical protein
MVRELLRKQAKDGAIDEKSERAGLAVCEFGAKKTIDKA